MISISLHARVTAAGAGAAAAAAAKAQTARTRSTRRIAGGYPLLRQLPAASPVSATRDGVAPPKRYETEEPMPPDAKDGREELPATLKRSPKKAQETWIKAHDSAVE